MRAKMRLRSTDELWLFDLDAWVLVTAVGSLPLRVECDRWNYSRSRSVPMPPRENQHSGNTDVRRNGSRKALVSVD
ncbi:Uncharacterized protein HZ326_4790 [Fusarium oxysporum f. sp. albedinis]|nr:Uncharacterized protein HZ326_4790 [Fusarium oxysporum f. sp. albedinis]